MTIKDLERSIQIYKRTEQITGKSYAVEISLLKDDIEQIRKENRTKKMIRNMQAKKDQRAWGDLIESLRHK